MKAIMRDKAELRDSGIEWIGDIPENWTLSKIKYHVSGYKAGPFGSSLITSKLDHDGELLVYTPEHVAKKSTNIDGNLYLPINRKEEMSQFLVSSGDVVFPIVGSLGRAMQIEDNMPNGIINQRLAKFCISESDIIPSYFMWLFGKSTFYETYIELFSRGSIIVNLTKQIVGNMPLPLPSVIEQQDIIKYLDDRCSKIDAIIAEAKDSIEEYKELKQAVIYEAVTKGLDKNVEMKDSGIEWIGKIPKTWEKIRIKYVLQIENGSDPLMEGEIPVYGSGADSFKTCGEFKNGPTVLLGRKGATLHIPHYIEGKYWNVDTAFNTLIKFSQSINMKYFYYLATCFDYKRYMSQTTLPSMTQTAYNNMIIPYPSYSEQNKIVQYLEQKLQQICMVISQKQSLIEELESYKKSLIYEVVTGKRKVVE